jgi:phenylacetate-CoA ligase
MPAAQDTFLARPALAALQREKLRALLAEVLPRNRFYADKFASFRIPADPSCLPDDLGRLPFTTKAELLAEQERDPPYGRVLTYPPDQYTRLHQTSGTAGRPLCWLDTAESWAWMLACWDAIYETLGLGNQERLFFGFSFGPFLGFWTAFEAAARRGWFCLPGGGLSSAARLRLVRDHGATIALCTPTYALRLAEVAREEGIALRAGSVKVLIVAGEPGGGIPATRRRIEDAWGARLFDHYGLTETGPVAVECPENPAGLHILETEYIAEVIEPAGERPVPPGEPGELVLTNLGRAGSPLIRYRTGDLVRADPKPCPCGRSLLRLEGGVLGRADDMIHLRGNNLYPGALEAVIRRFAEVAEYRVEVDQTGPLAELRVEVEAPGDVAERVGRAIQDELLFRAEVVAVPPGSLPRFDMKAKRVHHKGTKDAKEAAD